MTASSQTAPRPRLFYGWIVIAIAFVTMGVAITARTGLSLLYPQMLDEFGWSSGATAGAVAAGFVVSTLTLPLVGWMMDRWGPRVSLPVGALLVAAGYAALTQVTSLVGLYIAVGALAVNGSMAMSYIAHSMFLPNWFVRNRGLAVGLAFSGVGVGGIVLLPAMQAGIEAYGWRTAALAMAGLIVVVIVPLNALFQRRSPQEMGLNPDGDPNAQEGVAPRGPGAAALIVDHDWAATEWTLRLALRTARFWWVSGGFFLGLFIWYAIQMHQTRFLIDVGVSPTLAATALGMTAFCGIVGQIGMGALSDRIGREPCWTLSAIGFATASVAFMVMEGTPATWLMWVAVGAQGLLGYGLAALFGAVIAEIFAGKRLASIFAAISVSGNIGGGLGAWMMGAIHDASGSYRLGFALCFAASILSAICIRAAAPGKVRRVAGKALLPKP
jgi:MFS family permease